MFAKIIIKWIMLFSNIVAAIALLFTLIGTVVSPQVFIFPAYFTLAYSAIVVVNIGFVVFWMLARKWAFLLSLSILLFSAGQIRDAFPLNFGKTEAPKTIHPFSILTYNTMMSGKLVKHTAQKPNKVIQYILDTDADIVCLQEFMVSSKSEFITHRDMLRIFRKYPYKHIDYKVRLKSKFLGIATFSKYPIIHRSRIEYESEANISIYSDILIHGKTIRLINNHLESNRLTEKDKNMPQKLKTKFDAENITDITLHFSRKLGTAYKLRAQQADAVANVIEKSPYKVIVCGDFNDVPGSYAYSHVKGQLNDAYSNTGFGFGNTFNERFYSFRIDYLLYDATAFAINSYKRETVKYSDHYPVYCCLDLKNPQLESDNENKN